MGGTGGLKERIESKWVKGEENDRGWGFWFSKEDEIRMVGRNKMEKVPFGGGIGWGVMELWIMQNLMEEEPLEAWQTLCDQDDIEGPKQNHPLDG